MFVNTKLAGVLLWVSLFIVSMGIIATLMNVPNIFRVAHRSGQAIGVATSAEPTNHMSVTVRFSINGATHERTFPGYGYHVLSPVRVYFYPENPDVFLIEQPNRLLRSQLIFCLLSSGLLSTVIVGSFSAWRRRIEPRSPVFPGTRDPRSHDSGFGAAIIANRDQKRS
jgi:hypothetical protein